MASIRLERLGKTFPGDCVALSDVNLEVNDGEFLVLVGPSGCGKSTALRLIAGLEQPSDGDILVDGQSIVSLAPAKRDVALVFQNYTLYPNLTGQENLIFGLKKRGLPKDEVASRVRGRSRNVVDHRSSIAIPGCHVGWGASAHCRGTRDGPATQGTIVRRAPIESRRAIACAFANRVATAAQSIVQNHDLRDS